MDHDRRREQLSELYLFDGIEGDLLDAAAEHGRFRNFDRDRTIVAKGEAGDEVFFILHGGVRIIGHIDDHRSVFLTELGAGSSFGELSAIDGSLRSAWARTTRPTRLVAFDQYFVLDVMRRSSTAAFNMMRYLSGVIRSTGSRLTGLCALSARQRICGFVLERARPDKQRPGQWICRDFPSHEEVAGWTGSCADEVAAVLGDLIKDGVLSRRHHTLLINDVEALRTFGVAACGLLPRTPGAGAREPDYAPREKTPVIL